MVVADGCLGCTAEVEESKRYPSNEAGVCVRVGAQRRVL